MFVLSFLAIEFLILRAKNHRCYLKYLRLVVLFVAFQNTHYLKNQQSLFAWVNREEEYQEIDIIPH